MPRPADPPPDPTPRPPHRPAAADRRGLRRRWLRLIPLLLLLAWPRLVGCADAEAPPTPQQLIQSLRAAALQTLRDTGGVRQDGHVYAVDVGQLATFAALAQDRPLYTPLRAIILEQLLVTRVPGDPAHGMVGWRYHPDPAPGQLAVDASGTTEALRAAEALFRGSQAFPEFEDDLDTVALILDAYARHATVDGQTWMIRNYFNLDPRVYTYSTNSFLVDYDPDLIQELADAQDRADWRELARQSADLIEKARTPAGLLHQMIRPEVRTIMPALLPEGIYSANGIEQLNNVLTVAERCVRTRPEIARAAAAFCRDRLDDLRLYYLADTGGPIPDPAARASPGPETWGPLLRLAVKLGDAPLRDHARDRLIRTSASLADRPAADQLYLLGESLLALQYAVDPRFSGFADDTAEPAPAPPATPAASTAPEPRP